MHAYPVHHRAEHGVWDGIILTDIWTFVNFHKLIIHFFISND